jgi:hypothetical protein
VNGYVLATRPGPVNAKVILVLTIFPAVQVVLWCLYICFTGEVQRP